MTHTLGLGLGARSRPWNLSNSGQSKNPLGAAWAVGETENEKSSRATLPTYLGT